MNLIKAVAIDSHGIKLLNASNGRELRWGKANVHFTELMNPTLEELSDHGCVAIYTYGIRNNRLIRGSLTTTSTHASGLHSNGYKHWRDESVGALGFDLVKALFEVWPATWPTLINDGGKAERNIQTSLVVTDPGDLRNMIKWLEARKWRLYHKRINSVSPYHLHLQPFNLKGVL